MTTPTDWQALCAELLAMLDAQALRDPEMDGGLLRRRARTALAQPEPEGVTDEQWDAIKDRLWDKYETVGYQGERFMSNDDFDTALDVARQELASTSLAQPEPEGVTASDVTELFYRHMGEGSEVGFENAIAEALARWGRPTIKPVPVAERLPGPEDCFSDQHGQRSYKCWAQQYHTDNDGQPLRTVLEAWDLVDYRLLARCRRWYYAWLPHHALPVPGAEANHG